MNEIIYKINPKSHRIIYKKIEFKLNWTPNADIPYLNTWLTFKAKDIDSDNLVEYRICDLPENRFEDIFDLAVNDFFANCPGYSALGNINTRWHR